MRQPGYLYAIKTTTGLTKIGRAVNPNDRLRNLETLSGLKIINRYVSEKIIIPSYAEKTIHAIFQENRKIGEWFDVPFDEICEAIKTKPWRTPEYFSLVERKKNQEPIDRAGQYITELLLAKIQQTQHDENIKQYHCSLCRCPVEQYQPLSTYPFDDGCELYYDYADMRGQLIQAYGFIDQEVLIDKCVKVFSHNYPAALNINQTIKELIDIDVDLGVLMWVKPGFLGEFIPSNQIETKTRALI